MPLNKAGFSLISSLLFLGLETVNVTHLHGKWGMDSRDCIFLKSSYFFCWLAFLFFWARTFHMNYEQILHPLLLRFRQQVQTRARTCIFSEYSLCEMIKFCRVWFFFFNSILSKASHTAIFSNPQISWQSAFFCCCVN